MYYIVCPHLRFKLVLTLVRYQFLHYITYTDTDLINSRHFIQYS